MRFLSCPTIIGLIVSMAGAPVLAQTTSDGLAWRTLADKLEGGTTIEVRLRDGKHFKATFIAAHEDAIEVQRKTRVPVVIERVPYDTIASLSRVEKASLSAGKVAGIVIGSVGATFGVLILLAALMGGN